MVTIRWYAGRAAVNSTVESVRYAVQKTLLNAFGGCTRFDGSGAWRSLDGDEFAEKVDMWEVVTNSSVRAKEVAEYIRTEYKQLAVLVTVETIEARFV